jgi:hypothetical protein
MDTAAQAPLLETLRMQTRFSVMTGHVMLGADAIQPSLLDELSKNLAEGGIRSRLIQNSPVCSTALLGFHARNWSRSIRRL